MTPDEIGVRAMAGLAKVPPCDRADTEAHMSLATAEAIVDSYQGVKLAAPIDGGHIFGLTVRQDDTVPYGEVRYVTENAHDRAFRRAREARQVVNITRMECVHLALEPAAPTLRALLAHWRKKITSDGIRHGG